MGERSTPIISAAGYSLCCHVSRVAYRVLCMGEGGRGYEPSAMSMAQIPVPHPRSRMRCGFEIGARCSLLSSKSRNMWCAMSSWSFCTSSLGPQYSPSRNLWYRRPFSKRCFQIVDGIEVVSLRWSESPYAESVSSKSDSCVSSVDVQVLMFNFGSHLYY